MSRCCCVVLVVVAADEDDGDDFDSYGHSLSLSLLLLILCIQLTWNNKGPPNCETEDHRERHVRFRVFTITLIYLAHTVCTGRSRVQAVPT